MILIPLLLIATVASVILLYLIPAYLVLKATSSQTEKSLKLDLSKTKTLLELSRNQVTQLDTLLTDQINANKEFCDASDEATKAVKHAMETLVNEFGNKREALGKEKEALGKRLLNDNRKVIFKQITPNNYATSTNKLTKVIDFCNTNKHLIDEKEANALFEGLKEAYEAAVRKEFHKQEQARIKEQIREEQRAEKEREREISRLENEQFAIEKALQAVLRKVKGEHSDEIERLKALLEEARSNSERAKSQAQLTKSGHVYVISNIGSFGRGICKIGMTRRLVPMDRVKELGDASVPFPFDVHMMISCDDAPALENTLHKELHETRVNKVNLRKEFFRVDVDRVHGIVQRNHGEVEYEADPEAIQYFETLNISGIDPEDSENQNNETVQTVRQVQLPIQAALSHATCPHCKAGFSVPQAAIGKNAKCPKCGKEFVITCDNQ